MKVLVVENDTAVQKILRLFLEQSGYKPVIVETEEDALESMSASDAPTIAIFDSELPRMNGAELCKRLRGLKSRERPYLLMLGGRGRKEDVVAGLDAGADDFVYKPFNIAEMQARLRVAVRTVEYQRELQKQIDENRLLNERNDLLSELISSRDDNSQERQPATSLRRETLSSRPRGKFEPLSAQDLRFLLSATMLELKLVLESFAPCPSGDDIFASDFCSWGTVLLPDDKVWLDTVLVAPSHSLERCFEKSLRRSSGKTAERLTFISEMARRVIYGFARTLQARGETVRTPFATRAQELGLWADPVPAPPEMDFYEIAIEGFPFVLGVAAVPDARLESNPANLEEFDLLAEPFPATDVSAVPLFNDGVILNGRYIDRIASHAEHIQYQKKIPVWRPTPLGRHFSRPKA